ncbi:hypothetical protein SAMN05421541_104214 [Actinoplanes philippinensis]|uniref:Uncharacterized protein n=1 Tax=Actinoplanes philippinensis TaxID=35752 RepID=A0A1I2E730_9ACTN|nr:hypothetical protein SAMN05421541_104214 [Actinoplanes philippinensis]
MDGGGLRVWGCEDGGDKFVDHDADHHRDGAEDRERRQEVDQRPAERRRRGGRPRCGSRDGREGIVLRWADIGSRGIGGQFGIAGLGERPESAGFLTMEVEKPQPVCGGPVLPGERCDLVRLCVLGEETPATRLGYVAGPTAGVGEAGTQFEILRVCGDQTAEPLDRRADAAVFEVGFHAQEGFGFRHAPIVPTPVQSGARPDVRSARPAGGPPERSPPATRNGSCRRRAPENGRHRPAHRRTAGTGRLIGESSEVRSRRPGPRCDSRWPARPRPGGADCHGRGGNPDAGCRRRCTAAPAPDSRCRTG